MKFLAGRITGQCFNLEDKSYSLSDKTVSKLYFAEEIRGLDNCYQWNKILGIISRYQI